MGLGRGDAEAAASLGVSRFRAESCSRVLTTSRQPLSQLDSRRLTPDRVCTRSGCDTSNDGGSEVDQWTVLCRLSREFRRRIWEFASEVGFRSRVAVEVDRPTGKFRVHERIEKAYRAGMIPTREGPRPLYNAFQPSSTPIRLQREPHTPYELTSSPYQIDSVDKVP